MSGVSMDSSWPPDPNVMDRDPDVGEKLKNAALGTFLGVLRTPIYAIIVLGALIFRRRVSRAMIGASAVNSFL